MWASACRGWEVKINRTWLLNPGLQWKQCFPSIFNAVVVALAGDHVTSSLLCFLLDAVLETPLQLCRGPRLVGAASHVSGLIFANSNPAKSETQHHTVGPVMLIMLDLPPSPPADPRCASLSSFNAVVWSKHLVRTVAWVYLYSLELRKLKFWWG